MFVYSTLKIPVQNLARRWEIYRTFHNVLRDYIYNKKTKWPTLMEFFTATGKLKKFFFYN